jgi:hypothetical protein
MADAAFDDTKGATSSHGSGCGQYGGAAGKWGYASSRQLVPGGHPSFWAHGVPGGLATVAFGAVNPAPIPLTAIGLPAPGCDLNLATLDLLLPALFDVPQDPLLMSFGGTAEMSFWIPDDPAFFGVTLAAQWFDWTQLASSNAMYAAVAATMPALDMVVIDGDATEASGLPSVYMAHVLRFEYQ